MAGPLIYFQKIEGAMAEQNSHPSSVMFQNHCTELEAGIEKTRPLVPNTFSKFVNTFRLKAHTLYFLYGSLLQNGGGDCIYFWLQGINLEHKQTPGFWPLCETQSVGLDGC